MELSPSQRDVVHEDGTARLLRFRPSAERAVGSCEARAARDAAGGAVLLVPSLINRWYVLDLRKGASVVEGLVSAGFDVFCFDWGEPNDEDRYLDWDAVLAKLARAVKKTQRLAGAEQIGLLGYCIGGTLCAIATALDPKPIASLINLAGPIDFSHAGFLGHMTNPRWFDPEAIASAGNMSAAQMQAGFTALRPTAQLAKMVAMADKAFDPPKLEAMQALDTWASDNIAFPAAAYVRYIRDLYQDNQLVKGSHRIRGRRVDLSEIRCPVLTVTTSRDAICPPPAAVALNTAVSAEDTSVITIPGGHVGAVVGEKAKTLLYPALADFFRRTLCSSLN